jgi:hypothetical protein
MNDSKLFFEGRTLLLPTKHGKERVLAPILEKALGVRLVVADIDTDALGTFSGEIERTLDPVSAALAKSRLAIERFGADLAVASEGSFGPDPFVGMVPVNEELLVLLDDKERLQIQVAVRSTDTNFSASEIVNRHQLEQFANKTQFPSHALILRQSEGSLKNLHKGITQWDELYSIFELIRAEHGSAWVETDMRAHLNPSRMDIIASAAHRLVERIQSTCTACGAPGFGITKQVSGLPCDWCGTATRAELYAVSECQRCGYSQEDWFRKGRKTEDPAYCERCNP